LWIVENTRIHYNWFATFKSNIKTYSNAIKFTKKGSVTIHVKPDTDKSINISVTDTGIGIAKDKQAAILKLSQAERGTSRKYGGTGLDFLYHAS
jgi:signal transduction histidine kinase